MKLVVSYDVGDGYEWSGTEHQPVEYESEEALAVHLEEFCNEYQRKHEAHYARGRRPVPTTPEWWAAWTKECEEFQNAERFKETSLYASNFLEDGKYVAPSIRTLEQWFEEEL